MISGRLVPDQAEFLKIICDLSVTRVSPAKLAIPRRKRIKIMKKTDPSTIEKAAETNLDQLFNDVLSTAKALEKDQIDSYNNDANSNWFLFLIYYVVTVRKLLKDLPEEPINGDDLDENRATIVPTIYLFKHTLELLFKYAQVTIQKKIGNHDINNIKRSFNIRDIYKILNIEEIAKKMDKDDSETKTQIKKTFKDLESLSDDYFFGHFLYFSKKDLNFTIIDKQNELFKYPVNHNLNIQVSPHSLYNLNKESIKKIKGDFKNLEEIFNNLVIYFSESNLN